MAFFINGCFIRLSSSSPPPTLPNPSPPPSSHRSRSKEGDWRRNCLTAAAVAVVTIATASAMEPSSLAAVAPEEGLWSEKRECLPWHVNSLENIMPENLPRPSPRRRSDGIVAYRDAPALAGGAQVHPNGRGCYSL